MNTWTKWKVETGEFYMNVLTDLDIAKKMASGEINNIVATGNYLLVPMRITGTGISSRRFKNKKGEIINYKVDRPESSFLSQEFLDMCAGLPVCLFHSGKKPIDYTNYKDYVIGNIFYPYIKDTEVWGVAKIYDLRFLDALDNKIESTSPMVISKNIKTDSDSEIYEEKLNSINHVAFVSAGHWDTDKPAIGNKKIIFEEDIPVNKNMVDPVGAEFFDSSKTDSGNDMSNSDYRDKILRHNKNFDPVTEDVIKNDAENGTEEKPKNTETSEASAAEDTKKTDECGNKVKVDAAEVVSPSNMTAESKPDPMAEIMKQLGAIADTVSNIGARVQKLEADTTKAEEGTSKPAEPDTTAADTTAAASDTTAAAEEEKKEDQDDVMDDDDLEKDELVDAITSLSDSAKGYVSVKVPRARRTETSMEYRQRILRHNKEFLDDKYQFLIASKIDASMKTIAGEAFDNLRDRIETERRNKILDGNNKKPGPHYVREAPGVERDMDFLRGRA